MTTGESDQGRRIRQRQGTLIRQLRTARNMSIQRVADAINALGVPGVKVTAGAVGHWENAHSSPHNPLTQLALAKVLDVKWSTIFSLDEEVLP